MQNTSHGTSRLCLGAPSGTYGTSQLGSLDWYFVKAHAPFEPVRRWRCAGCDEEGGGGTPDVTARPLARVQEWNRSRPFLIGAELAESPLVRCVNAPRTVTLVLRVG